MPSNIQLFNDDCMTAMAKMPDKSYDLAIVDPPYGIGMDSRCLNGRSSRGRYVIKQSQYLEKEWDSEAPSKEYHGELVRVSKNQIIWGANYLSGNIKYNGKWIVWHKNGQSMAPDSSDCELACSSFEGLVVKMFSFDWVGFGAINAKEIRIHPTQKPVQLYKWLLKNYAKPGDKILDTHGGSMSIAIACWDMGHSLDLFEIDTEYYNAGVKRFENHKKQLTLFGSDNHHAESDQPQYGKDGTKAQDSSTDLLF